MPIQRGNTDIMKSIQKRAKQVSEARGISNPDSSVVSLQKIETPTYEAGAFASMNRRTPINTPTTSVYEKRLNERLLESVETLGTTKEYFNATSALLTMYTMGTLTEGVMNSISKSDLKEIKGIIREFKSVIDSY